MTAAQRTLPTIEGPNGHSFKDAKAVERYYVAALKDAEWEWVREVREDAVALGYSADIARLDRKFGCDDTTIALALRLVQERLFP